MIGAHDRRAFLRGLVSLPLIGGGLRLIGQPTAAAVQPSRAMLADYCDWLAVERSAALRELYGTAISTALASGEPLFDRHRSWPDMLAFPPSGRAAVMLSAVGQPIDGVNA